MRLTVGPLPPAVYWRRRAVVLGSLLLVIILLVYSCGGSDEPESKPQNAGTTSQAQPGTETPGTGTNDSPEAEDASPNPTTPSPTPSVADSASCTDDEILVTPVPAAQQLARGATVRIDLKIKNRGKRTCTRDVGADLQELYIVARGGAQKIWSSDDCGGLRGNNVESFTPAFERAYTVMWNGRASTDCKERPLPDPGEYQLFGRVGTKRSAPVPLTLA